jgi:PAB1-binding protein PBP1
MKLEETCDPRDLKHWDQFAENRRKFGVHSTYAEELYTTPLDKTSEFFRTHELEAERTARLIEQEAAGNVHLAEERGQLVPTDVTEEDRYGAVILDEHEAARLTSLTADPTGVYLPPHKRQAP